MNSKCIFKYEVQRDLFELVLCRIREAFTLRKICTSGKRETVMIYLLRYYTQTCCFLYKISYNVLHKRKLNVELWLIFNYLNIKSVYQNTVLLQSIRNTINQIQIVDREKRFDVQKTVIPDILQLKVPLFVFKKLKYELNSQLVKQKTLVQHLVKVCVHYPDFKSLVDLANMSFSILHKANLILKFKTSVRNILIKKTKKK